jgi:hypothetical protein
MFIEKFSVNSQVQSTLGHCNCVTLTSCQTAMLYSYRKKKFSGACSPENFAIQHLLHHSIVYTFVHYRTIKMDAHIIAFLSSYLQYR